MNPYLENKEEIRNLNEKLNLINSTELEFKKKTKILRDVIYEQMNKFKCSHKNLDGTSASRYDGQDPGSGRSEHSCSICYKSL